MKELRARMGEQKKSKSPASTAYCADICVEFLLHVWNDISPNLVRLVVESLVCTELCAHCLLLQGCEERFEGTFMDIRVRAPLLHWDCRLIVISLSTPNTHITQTHSDITRRNHDFINAAKRKFMEEQTKMFAREIWRKSGKDAINFCEPPVVLVPFDAFGLLPKDSPLLEKKKKKKGKKKGKQTEEDKEEGVEGQDEKKGEEGQEEEKGEEKEEGQEEGEEKEGQEGPEEKKVEEEQKEREKQKKLSPGATLAFQTFGVLRLFSAHLPLPPPQAWDTNPISATDILASSASCLTALPDGFLLFDMCRGPPSLVGSPRLFLTYRSDFVLEATSPLDRLDSGR